MNGNANGINSIKRMELQYKNITYQFTINPESYDIKIPSRLNLVYTKAGAFIDLFGEGVKEISISGTTGLKANTDDSEHGYKKFLQLKALIEDDMNKSREGEPITDFLNFYNHTDGEAYVVIPTNLGIKRNVNQPLLYKYDLMFYAIRRVGDPPPSTYTQKVGNDNNIPLTATETVLDRDFLEKSSPSKFTSTNKALPSTNKGKGEYVATTKNGGTVEKW